MTAPLDITPGLYTILTTDGTLVDVEVTEVTDGGLECLYPLFNGSKQPVFQPFEKIADIEVADEKWTAR
jgi:hypothetical protein